MKDVKRASIIDEKARKKHAEENKLMEENEVIK